MVMYLAKNVKIQNLNVDTRLTVLNKVVVALCC